MNIQNWLNSQIGLKNKKTMPILSFPAVQLLNVNVKDLISNSEMQAKGMKAIAERTPSLASVSLMDLSVEAECFGSNIKVNDNEVPTVVGRIVSNEQDARDLKVPEVGLARSGLYIDAIAKACKLITDRPVLAGTIGPFSLAGRLVDVSEAMINCYEEPKMMHIVLQKATDFIINYAKSFKKAGANGIILAEPLTGLLSPSLAKEFSQPYVEQIVNAVQSNSFIVIYHNCGNAVIHILDSILATNCDAYHFGNSIKMEDVLSRIPSNVIAMGNIDPVGQFRNGTPDSIRQAVIDLMKKCEKYPNFIISSGCDIPPMSSWKNIDAYFKAVEDYQK